MNTSKCSFAASIIFILLGQRALMFSKGDISFSKTQPAETPAMYETWHEIPTTKGTATTNHNDYSDISIPNIRNTCIPIEDVKISGPAAGVVQVGYIFTATVSPVTTTQPITYVWQASEQSTVITCTDGLSDTAILTWNTPGLQVITTTARNAGSVVTDTHLVTIGAFPPTSVTIIGPAAGIVQTSYTFTATVSPISAIQPITYIWQASEHSTTIPHIDGLSDTATFTWNVSGLQTTTVTAMNAGGTVADTYTIKIHSQPKIYLPLVMRIWPPVPTLYSIDNTNDDGVYAVRWSAVNWGNSYVLEEDTDSSFTSAKAYTVTSTSHTVNDKGPARYYYRVKACEDRWCGGWSNMQSVDVLWEKEPNDNGLTQANGPIVSNLTYFGAFTNTTDIKDYFYFYLSTPHSVETRLTNIPPGCDYDLALRDASMNSIDESKKDGNANEHILTGVLPARRYYYVQVYAYQGRCSQPYHLRVVYE